MIYLVDTYDKENKFGVSSAKDKALLNQYLYFQASGQGPYFGQAAHFKVRITLSSPVSRTDAFA